VDEYLQLQGRFRHLLQSEDSEHIAAIQAVADDNIARYGLMVENVKETVS